MGEIDMIKSFKTFWKELYELQKEYGKWMKKHWKGYLLLLSSIIGGELLWFFRDNVKEKFSKKDEEQ